MKTGACDPPNRSSPDDALMAIQWNVPSAASQMRAIFAAGGRTRRVLDKLRWRPGNEPIPPAARRWMASGPCLTERDFCTTDISIAIKASEPTTRKATSAVGAFQCFAFLASE